jgi:hypothetical protein
MRKLIVLIFAVSISNMSLALTDKEKYDLFYSATDIMLVNGKDNKYSTFNKEIESLWKIKWVGNSKVSFHYFENNMYDLKKQKQKAKFKFKNLNNLKTLILYFDGNSLTLFAVNKKGKLDKYHSKKNNSFLPPLNITSLWPNTTIFDMESIQVGLFSLKTMVNLLQFPKRERAIKLNQLNSLKDLKTETIFIPMSTFYYTIGSDNDNPFKIVNKKENIYLTNTSFDELYPYKWVMDFSGFYPDSNYNMSSPYIIGMMDTLLKNDAIRYIFYTKKFNIDGHILETPLTNTKSYIKPKIVRSTFIYDKKEHFIINIGNFEGDFFNEKDLNKILNKINK